MPQQPVEEGGVTQSSEVLPVALPRAGLLSAWTGLSASRTLVLAPLAVALALLVTAILILIAGKNPLLAYWALLKGAVGSIDRIASGLNKSTPYILAGVGVALCFRAKVINIGSEGQIAVGGLAASWVALTFPALPWMVLISTAMLAGAVAGAVWAGIAAVIRLSAACTKCSAP